MTYNTEAGLVAELRSNVPANWGDDATSLTEVWCHDQAHMDILVWTPTTLIAKEAKLTDWGQALAQAYLHRWCGDYSYVATPAKAVTEKRLTEARRFGIGVIAVDSTRADIRQKAARNRPAKQIWQRLAGRGAPTAQARQSERPTAHSPQTQAPPQAFKTTEKTDKLRPHNHSHPTRPPTEPCHGPAEDCRDGAGPDNDNQGNNP